MTLRSCSTVMKPLRIAAIILVISAGLFGPYLILRNAAPSIADEKTSEISQTLNSPDKNPIHWLEKAAESSTNSAQGLADLNQFLTENKEVFKTGNKNSVNLTELVAGSLFGRIQQLDQSGENPFQSQGFDPNDPQNQQFIREAVAGINDPAAFFGSSVEDKDLKISNDNSKEAKLEYFRGIISIHDKWFSNPEFERSVDDLIKDINGDCLGSVSDTDKDLAIAYPQITDGLLSLSVPSDLLDYHREMLSASKTNSLIYQALVNCSSDPIKGYMAVQVLPNQFTQALKVMELLAKKIQESNF